MYIYIYTYNIRLYIYIYYTKTIKLGRSYYDLMVMNKNVVKFKHVRTLVLHLKGEYGV